MTLLVQNPWLLLPLAGVLSTILALVLIPVAMRIGLVDHPGERKVHKQTTPLVGGLAVFFAWSTAVAFSPIPLLSDDLFYLFLMAGAAALLMIGLLDDLHELSPILRLLAQIGVCVLMVSFGDVRLTDFGRLFTPEVFHLGRLSSAITVFAALGVINSFNLIDGMDGLSGTLFLIAAMGMAIFGSIAGDFTVTWLLLIAMAAVIGFLLLNGRFFWNKRARVFLGDAGSLMLGFILAWCAVRLGSGSERAYAPMTAVWIFAVPLLDTTTLIWRRWRAGRSALSADQNHLHHAFKNSGFSVGETWCIITLLALIMAGIGIALEMSDVPEYIGFYVFMVIAFAYYFYMKHSWASQRFLGRNFEEQDQ
jgi:UDP-GlcNAc:undecaprenyl-phosphate/decaprenyl-phosphate GlcNAc-1-phosphate transferase